MGCGVGGGGRSARDARTVAEAEETATVVLMNATGLVVPVVVGGRERSGRGWPVAVAKSPPPPPPPTYFIIIVLVRPGDGVTQPNRVISGIAARVAVE